MSDRHRWETEVKATRDDLADTVDALSRRLDVKSRATEAAADVTHTVQQQTRDPRIRAVGIAVLLGSAALAVFAFRRGRD